MILMEHPQHGRQPAYDTADIERFKLHGWTEVAEKKEPETPVEPEPVKRRGRPPKVAE